MSKNTNKKVDDAVLDAFFQETTQEVVINANQKLFFFFVAQVSTILPSYLFQGVKDLEFTGVTVALFLIVSTIAAVILFLAYQNIFLRSRITLAKRYETALATTGANKKKEVQVAKDNLIELGTTGYTLFFSNVVYLGLTLFFAFYALQRIDVRVNYTISLIASAGALYLLSTTKRRERV